jgi:hypothetical protein
MGKSLDDGAVVDSQGRVFGVNNLRVADASIFPQITNGNLNAPVIMVAERPLSISKGVLNHLHHFTHHNQPSSGLKQSTASCSPPTTKQLCTLWHFFLLFHTRFAHCKGVLSPYSLWAHYQ